MQHIIGDAGEVARRQQDQHALEVDAAEEEVGIAGMLLGLAVCGDDLLVVDDGGFGA